MPKPEEQPTNPTPETEAAASAEGAGAETDGAGGDDTPEDWSVDDVLSSQTANPGDDNDRADVSEDTQAGADDAASETADDEKDAADGDKAEAEGEDGAEDEGGQDEAELLRDLSEQELQKFTKASYHRIKALLRDRAKFRDRLKEVEGSATQAQPILERMQRDDLSRENVEELLEIGAMIRRGDFQGFTKAMEPYMQAARRALGDELPADLQEQVDAGEVTRPVAQELARRRHENALAQQRLQKADQDRQQDRQQQAAQQRATTVRDTLNSWEQQRLSNDPDYQQIQAAVQEQVQLEVRANGMPNTAEAATQMAQRALDRVKKLSRPASRPATPPRPPVSGTKAASAQAPKPETLDDVINSVLGG